MGLESLIGLVGLIGRVDTYRVRRDPLSHWGIVAGIPASERT